MGKIYVTGPKGRLGSELIRVGCIPVDCDLMVMESVQEALSVTDKNDVLIHTAAFTDVDACEDKQLVNKALKVNMWGTEYVRAFHKGKMIMLSTDYIFSGKRGPYDERVRRESPVNSYGYTKWAAETVFMNPHKFGDTIVRTTGLYGGPSGKPDLALLVRDNLTSGLDMDVINTLKGNQTYVPHLAEALVALATLDNPPMILNLGSKEVVSRYEFALMIANLLGLNAHFLHPVNKIEGWIAERPTKGGLKVKLAEKLGLPIYTIREGLLAWSG